jgi:ATP-dependent Clp endopeptidase proteolytic subunit ClpP
MHGARPLRSTRRLQNLSQGRPGWYSIKNLAGQPTQVTIYDEIGFFGVSASDFLSDLAGIDGEIEMHVNSPGGDIFDGIAIYNQLKNRKAPVKVVVDGLAASAASFIMQAASPGQLEVAPHSQVMIHDGFSMAIGNAADLRETADLLDKMSDEIASIYAERSGKPATYWRQQMQSETWYSDREAVTAGLADRISGQDAPTDSWDLSVYGKFGKDNLPLVNADGTHASMSGTHSHSHPAFGSQGSDSTHSHEHTHDGDASHSHKHSDPDHDGDNDSTAKGDTDHDYVKPDGSPGPKAGNRLINEADTSTWDGSKAMGNGAASDDPAKFYAGICAGKREGDTSKQSSWALPYKYHPGDAPNAAGTRNALARLPQTQGLTNASEAKATLERAMKQVDPDYDPDDYIDPGLLQAVFANALKGVASV